MSDDMQSPLQTYCATAFPTRQEVQVSDLLLERTGIRVVEVERLFASFS